MPWEVTAQFAIVAASSAGIEIYSNAGTELTVDLLGWFTGPQSPMTQPTFAGNPVPRQRVIAIGDSTMAGVDRNFANGSTPRRRLRLPRPLLPTPHPRVVPRSRGPDSAAERNRHPALHSRTATTTWPSS